MVNPFPHLLLLGHRGAPEEQIENTLASFALATRQGAHGVELDVRVAADGTPVVIHDSSLLRTFGVRGEVESLAWPALQRMTGARLPSLQQAAAWAASSGAWLNVELKVAGAEFATVDALARHGLVERSFVSSFDERIVAGVAAIAPMVRCFFLAEEWNERARDQLAASGAAGICLRVDAASPLNLEVLHHEGVPVVVWTVDAPGKVLELARAGVAAIITSRPGVASAALYGARTE